jgi:hypothetical protein
MAKPSAGQALDADGDGGEQRRDGGVTGRTERLFFGSILAILEDGEKRNGRERVCFRSPGPLVGHGAPGPTAHDWLFALVVFDCLSGSPFFPRRRIGRLLPDRCR